MVNGKKPSQEDVQKKVLDVKGLKTHFFTGEGCVCAVDGVDFYVKEKEVFGLVGESGCGKTVTSMSILRLVDVPGKIVAGEIYFEGQNLLELPEPEMVKVRGEKISMIFQQPQPSLNPVFPVGDQIAEMFRAHQGMEKDEAWKRAVELIKVVGIPDPETRAHAYPHELSGGQAQRIMIAMALSLDPKILIADEPSTALDVTIQAQILKLMRNLVDKYDTSLILITHNLGVIAEMANRVAVMYAGQIVESADVYELFDYPKHPYTQGLIESIPVLGTIKDRLEVIPGTVLELVNIPPGCRFAPRCKTREEFSLEICREVDPVLEEIKPEHTVRCWLYKDHGKHKAPLSVS
jgi:oligopeptide/dipeptide ABC transporter ATP-binding protein